PAWGLLAEAGVPVVVHCGHGPIPGRYTGLDVFGAVLAAHPRLVAVLAHAGLPDYDEALRLVRSYPRVYLDTTMVACRSPRHSPHCRLTGRPGWWTWRTASCSAPISRTSPTT